MVRVPAVLLTVLLVCPLGAQVERPVSDVRVGIASATVAQSATGAAGDGAFLAAWSSLHRGGQAIRLDAAGQRLDPTSIGLPLAPRFVFFDDGVWFVIGDDGFARIDRDGRLLDPQLRPFAQPLGRIIAAAWTGAALVVASHADRKVVVRALDASFTVTSAHTLVGNAASPPELRMASDGSTAIAVWHETTLMAAAFDARGAYVRTKSIATDAAQLAAVGTSGDDYLVVRFHPATLTTPASYSGFHLDAALRVEAAPTSIGHRGATLTHAPTLSWDGSAYTFFYTSPTDVRAARLSAGGTRIADTAVMPAEWGGGHGVSGGGATLLLYAKGPAGGPVFLHARAGDEDTALEVGAFEQDLPAAASSATQSLVVWRERIPGDPLRVYATRVARDGTVLDPQSIEIATGICELCAPSVTSNGETFLVAWYDPNGVAAAIVDANGRVRFRTRVKESSRFAWNGKPSLVASTHLWGLIWTQQGGERWMTDMPFAGERLFVPAQVATAEGELHVASDGRDYLMAWGGNARFVPYWIHTITPTHRIRGDSVSAVWWNGTTYSVLHGDASTYVITRFDAQGNPTPTDVSLARPSHTVWAASADPACDAKGCSLVFGTVEDGRHVFRGLRAEDDGVHASIRLGSALAVPHAHREPGETLYVAPLQAAGGALFAAYTRRVLEPPYAGISRVFLRPIQSPLRTRTVRH